MLSLNDVNSEDLSRYFYTTIYYTTQISTILNVDIPQTRGSIYCSNFCYSLWKAVDERNIK